MEVLVLGTGSADGWPNPWCECHSCAAARTAGVLRTHTSVLVDGSLLIDCGPDVPRSAARLGVTLAGVRTVVFGHAHPDHCGPQALMWRPWSTASTPLEVVGPPAVIAACRPWVGPSDPVTFLELPPGGQARLATGHLLESLPANHGTYHDGPPTLPLITAEDGSRLLYATDTAHPLPAATLEALAGRELDLLLLEETAGDGPPLPGHHGLADFQRTLADLRRRSAVTDRTRVLAVHLGHANPPEPELRSRLAALGAELPVEGDRIRLPRGRGAADGGAGRLAG